MDSESQGVEKMRNPGAFPYSLVNIGSTYLNLELFMAMLASALPDE